MPSQYIQYILIKRENSPHPSFLIDTSGYPPPVEVLTHYPYYFNNGYLEIFYQSDTFTIEREYYAQTLDTIDNGISQVGVLRDNLGTEIRKVNVTITETYYPLLAYLETIALIAIQEKSFIEVVFKNNPDTTLLRANLVAPFLNHSTVKNKEVILDDDNNLQTVWQYYYTHPVQLTFIEHPDRYRTLDIAGKTVYVAPEDYQFISKGEETDLIASFNGLFLKQGMLLRGFSAVVKTADIKAYGTIKSAAEDSLANGTTLTITDSLDPNGQAQGGAVQPVLKTGFITQVELLGGLGKMNKEYKSLEINELDVYLHEGFRITFYEAGFNFVA